MKNVFRICFTLVFVLQAVFVLGQFTPEWDSINATTTPPTIDGVIDAVWADADSVPIKNLYSGAIVDDADFSCYWRGMYDDTALFIMIHVMDDTLMNEEANAWSNDNVEIFLNTLNKIDVLAKDGPRYDSEKFQYRVIYGKTDSTGTNADWTDVLFASAAVTDGYVIEVAFPLTTILIDTIPGHSTWIGFDLSVIDKDSLTGANLTWSNPGGVNSSWNDMDQAGIIIFSEGLPLVADTTLLSDLIADAEVLLADPNKPQVAKDSLQGAVDTAQALIDADTANQAEILGAMLPLGAVMTWYNQQILPVEGEFSPIDFLGNAKNYTEVDPWLWEVFADTNSNDEMVYGITQDKPAGGNRTSILNTNTYGAHGNFFVSADMKLQKRPSAVAETPWWEDGRLYFAYQDANNYAWAQFFNTTGLAKDNPIGQTDALGLSGFNFMVDGKGYGFMHSDDPGDPIEEIPPEVCIPFEGDTSFYDWNEVMVTLKDSVLSMLVNGEVYHSIGLDTVTFIEFLTGNRLDSIDSIPSAVLDLVFTPGQIGIGSANDRVYFDNVNAGYIPAEGMFSNIDFYGDAGNYDEKEGWLWDVFDDGGEMVYGIVQDKPAGGNRTTITNGGSIGGHDYYLKADMKLQKRPSGVADTPWWEDGRLYFAYQDANNYAWAQFFNTHGPAKDNPIGQTDALGLSGLNFMVDGQGYGFMHSDDPGDPIEEIPPETCIPYVDDTSFDDWNEVMVMLEDSVLSMVVNGEVYHAIGLDTVTSIEFLTGNRLDSIDAIPSAVLDLIFSAGEVGIGSSNDRVYFDNVEAGWIEKSGIFDDENLPMGDAANWMELNPWLWDVVETTEEDYEVVYGVTAEKAAGGNRKSIYQPMDFDHDYWVSMDAKLFKRPDGMTDAAKFEDAVIYFSYIDEDNFAQAMFFNTAGIGVTGSPVGAADAFGMSGFRVMYEGQEYRLTKLDDPGDPIEEIPAETCIPFEDDGSFNDWNWIQFEREGTILRMMVNGDTYFELDVDTLTLGQVYNGWQFNHWEELPQGAKDLMLGKGKIGIGSSNDKVLFDWIYAGYIGVEGEFSDIAILGEAGNYTEVNPWLWDVLEEDGDTRYGITAAKEAGGNRMSILNDEIYGDADFFVSADVKLFKRASGPVDSYFYEDARLFFVYQDANNYASADFFNHHGPVTGAGNDAYGLSGFVVVVDGKTYKLKHGDDPGDPIEEIPPETCIPYVDDTSFDDWNTIKVVRVGTILQMMVNGNLYYQIDVDTLTMAQTVNELMEAVPQAMKDLLEGPGQIGIGSGNDKVYFDNVDAGVYTSVEDLIDAGSMGVLVFPNPAAGEFTLSDIDNARKVEIYNLTGQKVMEVLTHGESSLTIGTGQFDSGLYFIRTTMDTGKVAINKLIIR